MTTPTREVKTSYAILDVKPASGVTASQIAQAVTAGLKKGNSDIAVTYDIPPSPLPVTPARFELVDPFAKSNLGALLAAQGQGIKVPKCDGAILTGNASARQMQQYGEGTIFMACLFPYQGGYHIDIYTRFTQESGSLDPKVLAATLMRPITGDSSQFIPRTINNVVESVKSAGAEVTLVESYP